MAHNGKYIELSQFNSDSQIPKLINKIAMDPYSYFVEAKQVCYADLHNCAHDIISGGKGGSQPSWSY